MSNLQLRIISGLVLAAAVLGVTWLGGVAFRLFAVALAFAIFHEWARMARNGAASASPRLRPLPEIALLGVAVAIVAGMPALGILGLILVLTLALAILSGWRRRDQWETGGFAYAAFSGFSLALLRGDGQAGLLAILFLFTVVWSTDILAYFVGKAAGGPKLAPSISPGKTRSGAIGGLVSAVVAALIFAHFAGSGSAIGLALAAAALSVVSQAGDLFESWVKRRHGVKDSGQIIPGHGGVMDRADALVAAALGLYLIGWAASGPDQPALRLFG